MPTASIPRGPNGSTTPESQDRYQGSTQKIWLVHGSFTGGHASAARSLAQQLSKYPGVTTEIINTAESSNMAVSTAAEAALKGGSWIRSLRSRIFEEQFEGNKVLKWGTDLAFKTSGYFNQDFLQRVEAEKPDLIVATQASTASLLNSWTESGRLEVPVHGVVTDFAAHQVWAQENIVRYYVASAEVAGDLERFGVDPQRVSVTGIPIKEGFAPEEIGPGEARRRVGLDPNKPTVLMMGGSWGLGNFEETISHLDRSPEDFQVAVITGKNKEAKAELEALKTQHPLHVHGYVNNMSEWLEAADVVVSRPGGLTCSEMLAKGTGMVFEEVSGGLSARNITRLTQSGAALKAASTAELASRVEELMGQPEQLEAIKSAARAQGHPDSAAEIARDLMSSL